MHIRIPLLLLTALACSGVDSYIVSCYYRYMGRELEPQQLQGSNGLNCTHVIVGFASVGDDYSVNLTQVGNIEGLKRFVETGKPMPSSKMMLSVGGGGNDNNFKNMASDGTKREIFIKSMANVLRETLLDGFDYDWEFPDIFQARNFAKLITRTREILDAEQTLRSENNDDTKKLDLSLAVPGPLTLTAGFDINAISQNCDFVNVMTYDLVLYSKWYPRAYLHNALYGQGSFLNPVHLFSVSASMEHYVNLGIPRHKLLLGLPTYGVAYQLKNANKTELFSSITGYSPLGSNVNYDDLCQWNSEYPEGVTFVEKCGVPYFTDGKGNWFSYDDVRSITEKVEYAKKKDYGGLMIFSLNADDPKGYCFSENGSYKAVENPQTAFPLTKIAIATLNQNVQEN